MVRVAVLIALTTLTAACVSNTGQKVAATTAPAQTAQAQQPSATPAPTEVLVGGPRAPEVFKVGDTIKVQDHTLSVLSARRDGNRLTVDVQINNTGSKEVAVSALASFAAKDAAGEKLRYAFATAGGQLNGKILPNDKLKGALAYSLPEDATGLKLYYTPSLFGQGAIVVALDDDALKTPFPRPDAVAEAKAFKKSATFSVGDAVVNKGVVARLENASLDGTLVKASFLVYNGGDKDVTISSVASFDARDGEGTKGKYKLLVDSPPLDGKLVPGDTLQGSLLWEFASPPSGVKVYYTDSLFGGDTMVTSL